MKVKKWKAIVASVLAGVLLVGTAAAAAATPPDPTPSKWSFYLDGELVDLNGVSYNNFNYLKLRDFAKAMDFGVDYDAAAKTVKIDTSAHYVDPFEAAPTPKTFNDVPFHTVNLAKSDPNYYKELWAAEFYNSKIVKDFPTLFVNDVWNDYQSALTPLVAMDPDTLTKDDIAALDAAKEARERLIQNQLIPFSEEVIYLWGEGNMPVVTKNVKEQFNRQSEDNPDFVPFMVPYLVKDQSKAKGNIIVISGGGFKYRENELEGYLVCPEFVARGYNCFLLQRRVEPYNSDDIGMDLQRAIRVIRYNAEKWGLGGADIIAAAGFSGGSGTIMVTVSKFYGDITPDQFDSSYVCDAIDKVNSDLDVAMPMYGGSPMDTKNPNIPYMFIGAAGNDQAIGNQGSVDLFLQLQEMGLNPELQVYATEAHGFGPGHKGITSFLWMDSADIYMQRVMHMPDNPEYDGEIPAEYTEMQTITYALGDLGDFEVTVYRTGPDGNKYYIVLYAFGGWHILEGVMDTTGNMTMTIDDFIFTMNGDPPKMVKQCSFEGWTPVKK